MAWVKTSFSIWGVLTRTLWLVFRRFPLFLGLAAAALLLQRLLAWATLGQNPFVAARHVYAVPSATELLTYWAGELPGMVVGMALGAVITHRALADLSGMTVTVEDDLAATRRALPALIAIQCVWAALALLALLPEMLGVSNIFKFAIMGHVPPDVALEFVASLLLWLLVTALTLAAGLTWVVTVPTAIAEQTGPLDTFRRSQGLTTGYRGKIFFSWLLMALCNGFLSFVIWVGFGTGLAPSVPPPLNTAEGGALALLSALFSIVAPAGAAAIYAELRWLTDPHA